QLMRAKASQPGAPEKIRYDYAVVLAMSGNRAEAQRVLSDSLSPDEINQVLDSVTGTHTRTVRDGGTDPASGRVAIGRSGQRLDDGIPPDVVENPEPPVAGSANPPAPR